jgi:hypothetical protein
MTTSDRFRRIGEKMRGPGTSALAAGVAYRQVVAAGARAEADLMALRAVCADGVTYERAPVPADADGNHD